MRKTTAVLVAAFTAGLAALAPTGVAERGSPVTLTASGYGLTDAGSLVRFSAANTLRARRVGAVTGLAPGEKLVGIDIQPVAGELYGLSDRSNLYTIDMQSARGTMKASLRTPSGAPVALAGTSFGIDFNPTSGRLRVTSDAAQNLRIDVDSGITAVDQPLAYRSGDRHAGSPPKAVGVAYTNNDNDSFVGPGHVDRRGGRATGTKLFTIDAARRSLALQDPPNDGALKSVGSLRQRTASVGFDIFSPVNSEGNTVSNVAYASLRRNGRTRLYKVSLATGRAKPIRGGGRHFRAVTDIAIVP